MSFQDRKFFQPHCWPNICSSSRLESNYAKSVLHLVRFWTVTLNPCTFKQTKKIKIESSDIGSVGKHTPSVLLVHYALAPVCSRKIFTCPFEKAKGCFFSSFASSSVAFGVIICFSLYTLNVIYLLLALICLKSFNTLCEGLENISWLLSIPHQHLHWNISCVLLQVDFRRCTFDPGVLSCSLISNASHQDFGSGNDDEEGSKHRTLGDTRTEAEGRCLEHNCWYVLGFKRSHII